MNKNEANKIIAEYLFGENWSKDKDISREVRDNGFSKSLDKLVPVWEQLRGELVRVNVDTDRIKVFKMTDSGWRKRIDFIVGGCGIMESSCIATAMAIKELENE